MAMRSTVRVCRMSTNAKGSQRRSNPALPQSLYRLRQDRQKCLKAAATVAASPLQGIPALRAHAQTQRNNELQYGVFSIVEAEKSEMKITSKARRVTASPWPQTCYKAHWLQARMSENNQRVSNTNLPPLLPQQTDQTDHRLRQIHNTLG